MRRLLFTIACIAPACTSSGPSTPESTLAFTIQSTDFMLQPGQEVTKCFYFHTPNTAEVVVNKWVSDMTPGSHHMIVFSNLTTQPADGTIDNCEGAGTPLPIYGSQIPHAELDFPSDDGFGKPLAQLIEPNMTGYFQMHYLNTTDGVLPVHVSLSAYGMPTGTEYTRTDLFATYNNDISIPPGATNFKVSATCEIFDKKFWQMSTHSHKQSIETDVIDGTSTVLTSLDWEHPDSKRWDLPTYYQFQSPTITWSCTYNNTGDNATRTVTSGSSAQTNEMCMATGYYFPAVGPRGCVMDGGQCQCIL